MAAQFEAEAAARLAASSCELLTVVTVVTDVLHTRHTSNEKAFDFERAVHHSLLIMSSDW